MTSFSVGAGDLDQRWELQSKGRTRTSGGGVSVVWSKVRDVWCKITPLGLSMNEEARAREPKLTHEVIARLEGGDITSETRLVKGSRVLMIAGIPKILNEADNLIQFSAIEGVAT